MKENCPSVTALRVAMRRAAHQVIDDPTVFSDPLALRIVGAETEPEKSLDPRWFEKTPIETRLRAFLVARSRCAEDGLAEAIKRGVRQYVVLGAGLDTFAYRNAFPADVLQVFEVDHPATQAWKRTRLEEAGISVPPTVTFCPVDFDAKTLEQGLSRGSFDARKSAFFSWLGVTPYITSSAVTATLRFVASLPAGSGIVFDYMILPSLLNAIQRRAFDGLAGRVAAAGEPFLSFFDPSFLEGSLSEMGFHTIENLGPEALNARYFQGRTDELRVGSFSYVMIASF